MMINRETRPVSLLGFGKKKKKSRLLRSTRPWVFWGSLLFCFSLSMNFIRGEGEA